MDYLHLYREHGCVLEIGGSDQWGNITAGVDLVHRAEGESVHALATPLLVDASGRKFGKSEGNAVWLSPDLTSPYAFYQYFLNVEDASVVSMLKALTDRTREQITELERQVQEEPFRREAQRTLAADVTTLVHGPEATAAVQRASEALFGRGELAELDLSTLTDATNELAGAEVALGTPVVEALVLSGLADSRSAARRVIGEGGASVNNVKISDVESVLSEDRFLHGRVAVLKRGRKNLAVARRG
jgi:tyrosyl-tRNA synthetase